MVQAWSRDQDMGYKHGGRVQRFLTSLRFEAHENREGGEGSVSMLSVCTVHNSTAAFDLD